MTHPIVALQGALVAALAADTSLTALIGADAIFDAPPKDRPAPYAVIVRHDLLPRDGDATPGYEHRLLVHLWVTQPSRKALLAVAERVLTVAFAATLDSVTLKVTHRQHDRTDTAIEHDTGQARAAVALRFFSEPAS